MKETEEIMGMIKEEGAAYFARERGNKVEVGLYLEHIIEERGMKKKDIVRKLNLEESYARKLFGGQRIPQGKYYCSVRFSFLLICRIHKGFWISVRSRDFIRAYVTMQQLFMDWKRR